MILDAPLVRRTRLRRSRLRPQAETAIEVQPRGLVGSNDVLRGVDRGSRRIDSARVQPSNHNRVSDSPYRACWFY
jgi:hypothetical protein